MGLSSGLFKGWVTTQPLPDHDANPEDVGRPMPERPPATSPTQGLPPASDWLMTAAVDLSVVLAPYSHLHTDFPFSSLVLTSALLAHRPRRVAAEHDVFGAPT